MVFIKAIIIVEVFKEELKVYDLPQRILGFSEISSKS